MKVLATALAVAGLAVAGIATASASIWNSAPSGVNSNSQSYDDRAGDAVNGAPDISRIDISSDDAGTISMSIYLVNHASGFQPNEGVVVGIDADLRRDTGSRGFGAGIADGVDYILYAIKNENRLYVWDASRKEFPRVAPNSFHGTIGNGVITFSVNRADLRNTAAFDFYAFGTRDDKYSVGGGSVGDLVPDSGAYLRYTVIGGGQPPTTPTTTPPPPTSFVLVPVGVPYAGTRFLLRVKVVLPSGRWVEPTFLDCTARMGTTPLVTARLKGPSPFRTCAVTVPKGSAGKNLVVFITARYGGLTASRSIRFRIH